MAKKGGKKNNQRSNFDCPGPDGVTGSGKGLWDAVPMLQEEGSHGGQPAQNRKEKADTEARAETQQPRQERERGAGGEGDSLAGGGLHQDQDVNFF